MNEVLGTKRASEGNRALTGHKLFINNNIIKLSGQYISTSVNNASYSKLNTGCLKKLPQNNQYLGPYTHFFHENM